MSDGSRDNDISMGLAHLGYTLVGGLYVYLCFHFQTHL